MHRVDFRQDGYSRSGNMLVIISDCFYTESDIAGGLEKLNGRPIAELAVCNAKAVVDREKIFLSSQHEELMRLAGAHGITGVLVHEAYWQENVFLSPDIKYLMEEFPTTKAEGADRLVVLLSTLTPFLERDTLKSMVEAAHREEGKVSIALSPVRDHPLLSLKEVGGIIERYFQLQREYSRRQDFPPVYEPNNTLQIFRKGEWNKYDDLVLEGQANGFVTEGLDAFNIETRLDLLLARKISEIKQIQGLRTNADFMRFLASEDAFALQSPPTNQAVALSSRS